MKKNLFTTLCVVAGILLSVWDSKNLGLFLSLSLSVCLSLLGGTPWVAICTLFGMTIDFLNYSMPFYAFIYLYISVGCVWIKGFLFKITYISGFFFWLASSCFAYLISGEASLRFSILNTLGFFVFYMLLKGLKIEKNYKI